MKRREFIQSSAALSAVGLHPTIIKKPRSINKPKIGIIGCGLRGQNHINMLLKRDDILLIAIADPAPKMQESTKKMIQKSGKKMPRFYSEGEYDFYNMLEQEELDAVIIATPWKWHTEMAIACLDRNIFTGMEVCGGFSVQECWDLVRADEGSKSYLYFLENVCFRRDVMAISNMVKKGLFGEIIHLEGGYQHDLRGVKFNDGLTPYDSGVKMGAEAYSEAKWRTKHSIHRNGDLYPTHGVGPIAKMVNINRGNRFIHLTSMASKARGLSSYIAKHSKGGPNHKNAQIEYKLGDKVTTMIKCNNGESMVLHHDTNLPRPYSLGFRVQGTSGLWMDVNKSIHLEGTTKKHYWEDAQPYLDKYDDEAWIKKENEAKGAGHGGMDFFLMDSFIECVKTNSKPLIDVYDAASWLVITPLSEESIALGGMPQYFPDFTRGRWTDYVQ